MTVTDAYVSGGVELGGTAPVSFVHGGGQVASDIVVEWDFDNDGDFDQPAEAVTGYVMGAEAVTGRDWPSQLTGKAGPGQLTLTLLNNDDRFSYFNAASPLNQGANSLKVGRKIRVRTTAATTPDPAVLARDRFAGSGALGTDDTGLVWSEETGPRFVRGDGYATVDTQFTAAAAVVDVGTDDYYVQVTSRWRTGGNNMAVVYRFQDTSNFGWVLVESGFLRHRVVTGGSISSDAVAYTFPADQNYDAMTFGVHVSGTSATVYLEGVPLGSFTAASFASNEVGIRALWVSDNPPAYDSFAVWDGVPVEVEGILWTGDVASVFPSAVLGPHKIAAVKAEGWLSKAATKEVTPTAQVPGYPTGIAVGHVLNAAGLASPPGVLDEGDVATGAYGFDPTSALELARRFEETEVGFLYEMPEGPIAYASASARVAQPVAAGFSDAPGAQFGYQDIELLDWRNEIVNQVVAGVASTPPVVESRTTRTGNTGAGVANDVSVQMPATVAAGDLLVVVIASTVRVAARQWETPHGWAQLHGEADAYRIRGYAKVAKTGDGSRTYVFYDDTSSGGGWVAHVFRISNWYGTLDAVKQGDVVVSILSLGEENETGSEPPALAVPWGLQPTLFIAARAGLTSASGGVQLGAPAPIGYGNYGSTMVNGTVNGFDASLESAWRVAVVGTEDPAGFGADAGDFSGWEIVNSVIIAVRGFNGSPPIQQGTVTVQVDDLDSQDDHGGVARGHTNPSNLFATVVAAQDYGEAILATHADDRPIFRITFVATTSAGYRAQAIRRRVGDKVRLTANGDTGMGVDGDFFIESIAHRWTDAAKVWQVTWQLSPA